LVTPYTTFVIQGQTEGAASAENMALYDQAELNQAWGRTTIMARVQNQTYQQAAQANVATGANVINQGKHSVAQVGVQNLDLSLLLGRNDPDMQVEAGWIVDNIQVDQTIAFGSEAYFELARDPEARPFLQSGTNVVFGHQGQVIAIEDGQGDGGAGVGQTSQKQIATGGEVIRNSSYRSEPEVRPGPAGKDLARWAAVMLRILSSATP
jgi:hypothetical protein